MKPLYQHALSKVDKSRIHNGTSGKPSYLTLYQRKDIRYSVSPILHDGTLYFRVRIQASSLEALKKHVASVSLNSLEAYLQKQKVGSLQDGKFKARKQPYFSFILQVKDGALIDQNTANVLAFVFFNICPEDSLSPSDVDIIHLFLTDTLIGVKSLTGKDVALPKNEWDIDYPEDEDLPDISDIMDKITAGESK